MDENFDSLWMKFRLKAFRFVADVYVQDEYMDKSEELYRVLYRRFFLTPDASTTNYRLAEPYLLKFQNNISGFASVLKEKVNNMCTATTARDQHEMMYELESLIANSPISVLENSNITLIARF